MKRFFTGSPVFKLVELKTSFENPFYGFNIPDIKPVYRLDQPVLTT